MRNSFWLRELWITLLLTFCPFISNADNYEGYKSKIEGIGLWWLQPQSVNIIGPGDYVTRTLRFGENPEFAKFCDGKNMLYVYELGQKGFYCRNVKLVNNKGGERVYLAGGGSFQRLEIVDIDEADKKRILKGIESAEKDRNSEVGEGRYTVLLAGLKLDSQGFYTVSKEKLVPGSWSVSTPTKEDVNAAKNIASKSYKQIETKASYIDKVESVIGYDDARIVKMAERFENDSIGSYKQERYTVKISSRDIEIILLPTQYQFMALGGELVSSVVLKRDGNYSLVGHVSGCMRSVGADIDADGIPEIIMENCANTESLGISYYKIFPTIKPLISYSHF